MIQFAPSDTSVHTVSLSNTNTNEDNNLGGDIDINCSDCANLVINGCGESKTIIDGSETDRIFDIQSAPTTTIYGMTIKNGAPSNGQGGGISVQSTNLVLKEITFHNNTAEGPSGNDSDLAGGGGGSPGLGGGIYAKNSNVYIYEGVTFDGNVAKGGAGGDATNFDEYEGDLFTCSDVSSCPISAGGQGANTVGYSGSYNGGSPFVNTPTGEFNGGHGGLSYYHSMTAASTPHSGTVGTFGGGGGGAGNSFDGTSIDGSIGSLRAEGGESSSGIEAEYVNGDGGSGGAFGGAVFLWSSSLRLQSTPTFTNNEIILPQRTGEVSETENIFQFTSSSIFEGNYLYEFSSDDGHTDYECTSSTGFNCSCTAGSCEDSL